MSLNIMPAVAAAASPAAAANTVNSPTAARAPAAAYPVPIQRDVRSENPAVDDLTYFHTEEWPFGAEQHDRQKESNRVRTNMLPYLIQVARKDNSTRRHTLHRATKIT